MFALEHVSKSYVSKLSDTELSVSFARSKILIENEARLLYNQPVECRTSKITSTIDEEGCKQRRCVSLLLKW